MLLIDRKMPKSCIDCVCNDDDYRCNMTGDELDYDIAWTRRMPNCPLREEERKRGKWIWDDEMGVFLCSSCKNGWKDQPTLMGKPLFEWCPVCGAMMSKGEDDE